MSTITLLSMVSEGREQNKITGRGTARSAQRTRLEVMAVKLMENKLRKNGKQEFFSPTARRAGRIS